MSQTSNTSRKPRSQQQLAANARARSGDSVSLPHLAVKGDTESDTSDDTSYFKSKKPTEPPRAIDSSCSDDDDGLDAAMASVCLTPVTPSMERSASKKPMGMPTPEPDRHYVVTMIPENQHREPKTVPKTEPKPEPQTPPKAEPNADFKPENFKHTPKSAATQAAKFRQECDPFVDAVRALQDLPKHLERMTHRWEAAKKTVAARDEKIASLTQENAQLKASNEELRREFAKLKARLNV